MAVQPLRRPPEPAGMSGRGRPVSLVVAVSAFVAGCTGAGSAPQATVPARPPITVQPGSPSRAGGAGGERPTAADRSAVLLAYRRFWAAASTVDSRPLNEWRVLLASVASDPLLSSVLTGLRAQLDSGRRQYGVVRPRPTVVGLDRDRASIVDCQDASGSGVVDSDTGLAVSVGSAHTPVAAVLVRDRRGTWRVSEARYLDGGC